MSKQKKSGVIRSRKMKWTALAVATAIVVAPAAYSGGKLNGFKPPSTAAAAASARQKESVDRFIVTYRQDPTQRLSAASADSRMQGLATAARDAGVGIEPLRTLATGASVIRTDRKLDRAASKALMIALMKDPNVLAVEPDRRLTRQFVPNDPAYAQQWHYQAGTGGINAEGAWDLSSGAGVVVAVLDTGSTPHVDLAGAYVAGYDFIDDLDTAVDGDGRDADPNDPGDWHSGECNIFGIPEDSSWHGTHVAGTVAAATDNGIGVAGVAHGAKVQPVRVLGKCGGFISDIADAITWASGGSVAGVPDNATPAEVINLSLGGGGSCPAAMQAAIDGAVGRGTTVVVAAGNSSSDASGFTPANCDNVIAVAATGPDYEFAAGYSNFGDTVDVAAPGGSGVTPAEDNILSTLNSGATVQEDDVYAWYAGTSMAAPHVAGTVALMQAAAPMPKTPAEIEEILVNTAYAATGFPVGCSYSKSCGSGVIDARYAVSVASGAEPLPDAPPPPPPPPPATPLENGVTVTDIEVLADESVRYELAVPNGASNLLFAMYGGTGDADIYVRHGDEPTDTAYDCRPFSAGNNETCFFPAPESGTWYVTIKGFSNAAGVSLYPSFVDPGWPRALEAEATQLNNHRTRVQLQWTHGARFVDIYRNGAILKTVRNRNHSTTDTFRIIGSGTMTYEVCNNGTRECSDPVSIDYASQKRRSR
ncbi:S8 family peptidase [Marilutibacter chinensis]|uniref:S8 family serine peptidase n=1 Tax=Marilutibacter chinensis TaxID=2912247 RepID=A0ABS9HUM5_9GAMM|nr:S8 family peptidase [Lysobacter chinensis]MCF7222601.1 S8 family serine peptidase [Lysobacter chinensis]